MLDLEGLVDDMYAGPTFKILIEYAQNVLQIKKKPKTRRAVGMAVDDLFSRNEKSPYSLFELTHMMRF